MRIEHVAAGLIDYRPHISAYIRRISDDQPTHRTGQQLEHVPGDILLQIEHAQRRAALSGTAEGRLHDIEHHLFGQCRAVLQLGQSATNRDYPMGERAGRVTQSERGEVTLHCRVTRQGS